LAEESKDPGRHAEKASESTGAKRREGKISVKNLQIRDARPNDRDVIREITLAAYEEYAALIPAHWEGYRESILATLADVGLAEQFVAVEEGVVAGAVLLFPAGTVVSGSEDVSLVREWPEVRLLAVAPAARGRGIGTVLMRECIRRARRAGASFLSLHTTDVMRAAMCMYEHLGFERFPEIDFYVAEDLTVKGYRLSLKAPPLPANRRRRLDA
jgi:GNAT superfamily N-acetyltransferase